MGIKNVVKKVGDKAGNKVAKLASLSSDQVEEIQLQREAYLLEEPKPDDDMALETNKIAKTDARNCSRSDIDIKRVTENISK